MWCDNCLLIFPLRGGAIAWNVVIALYSIAGGIFLLKWGQYLFFLYPEWYIYGGIGMAVAGLAVINIIALSNRSFVWSRVCVFLWPIFIIVAAIRAILMIVELGRYKNNITWECENGGQLWSTDPGANNSTTTSSFPDAICGPGFTSLLTAFIVSLIVDVGFQIYAFFLNWRFNVRLRKYSQMQGPFHGGYYG